ncbi:DMT family transporter [[Limnothrix rosea] IAM M-220]|uniref:DMT family transporter n=1 Tax=[Limnothrix rosea] IAM M-220 TaxID=454133 RepID=UPI00095B46C2|nr:DMT family transporter [[Limnothrix rosea] IAM M-220]OKH19545.1 EamA family transporter [[Limnothrix rosea] IAM M-220]
MTANLSKDTFIKFPLVLIAPFFLWGTAMVAMKGVLEVTSPLFLASIRLVPAGILVLLFARMMGREQKISAEGWIWICGFALIDGLMFQGFLAEGLVKTGAGLGSVMIDSQPLAVALLSSWLFGERIGLWGWLGLTIGILGISLIGIPDDWIFAIAHGDFSFLQVENLEVSGEVLMLGASLSMAVGTILIRYVSRYVDPVVATGWHMIIGGLPLLIASGFLETQQWQNIDLSGWLALSYATIFGSAIAYSLFFLLASKGNLTSLSALTFLTPIFALIFGHLLLSEELSNLQWFGVALTLVSIYLINQRERIAKQWRSLTPDTVIESSVSAVDKEHSQVK